MANPAGLRNPRKMPDAGFGNIENDICISRMYVCIVAVAAAAAAVAVVVVVVVVCIYIYIYIYIRLSDNLQAAPVSPRRRYFASSLVAHMCPCQR